MKKLLSLAAMGLAMMACSTAYPTAVMAVAPTVLIMGEDWDEDTIPRKSQVFERVIDAVTNQLQQDGFKVIDETMATQDAHVQGRVRRTDSELFKLAKAVQTPPINAVATFKIYPRFRPSNTTTWMNALVIGRLLSVSTNESLGTFEVTLPEDVTTEPNCHKNRQCTLEYMGKHARVLGQELGAALGIKLRRATITSGNTTAAVAAVPQKQAALAKAYKLTFDNFKPGEFDQVEEYLVAFSDYDHHKVIQSTSRNFVIWYETTSEDARLKRNLRKMLEFMGVDGQVHCISHTCTVTKI
jgi:hypothetical protein